MSFEEQLRTARAVQQSPMLGMHPWIMPTASQPADTNQLAMRRRTEPLHLRWEGNKGLFRYEGVAVSGILLNQWQPSLPALAPPRCNCAPF